ncbi:hypothetical protein EVAR_32692_1 [Eumeta japonica]|uniref:Uncharacterized protein n=1 Tax=Eumeta variegata TaxID=151549 RepID=A0A4C1VR33_EUMVA|nr:hypothetical protein EVAR_32692_1 [Eumeta japonica]
MGFTVTNDRIGPREIYCRGTKEKCLLARSDVYRCGIIVCKTIVEVLLVSWDVTDTESIRVQSGERRQTNTLAITDASEIHAGLLVMTAEKSASLAADRHGNDGWQQFVNFYWAEATLRSNEGTSGDLPRWEGPINMTAREIELKMCRASVFSPVELYLTRFASYELHLAVAAVWNIKDSSYPRMFRKE